MSPAAAAQLSAALTRCRQQRMPLSLSLLEFDVLANRNIRDRENSLAPWFSAIRRAVTSRGNSLCLEVAHHRLAVIFENADRSELVEWSRDLIHWWTLETAGDVAVLSVGVGTIGVSGKHFGAGDLVAAATRCLDASHASGGSVVKSIEI